MADLAISGVSAQSAPAVNGANHTPLSAPRPFSEMYNEAVLRASANDFTPVSPVAAIANYAKAAGAQASANITYNVAAPVSADAETVVAVHNEEVARLKGFDDAPVPTDVLVAAHDENVPKANAALVSTAVTAGKIPQYVRDPEGELRPVRQVTDEDLTAAGYDVNVLKANALDFNPMAYITEYGLIPKYVVPLDLGWGTDYARTVGTAESLAQTLANNAALGFRVE